MTTVNIIQNSYTDVDANLQSDFDSAFIRSINYDTSGNYDKVAASNIVAYPGYSTDDLMTMENMFSKMEKEYNKATDVIKIGNDLRNVNMYIDNTYSLENKRIKQVLSSSENDVYLSRENFMLVRYNIAFTNFLTNVIMFSFFTAIVCAFVICFTFYEKFKITWTAASAILILVASIYVLGVVIFYRQTLVRRKDDWTKYYFNVPDALNNNSCA